MNYIRNSIFALVLIFAAHTAWGQATVERFLISVWPEYDHPGVLVIFNGEVDEEQLPLEMNYSIPENSRFALVVGTTDTTDRPQPIPIADAGSGKQITFNLIQPEFNVTFYYNPFQTGNTHRHYGYDFVSSIAIDTLLIDLQVPLMAEGFAPEMPVDQQLQDSHGISYHRANRTNVAAGDTVHIEAHYENPEGQLTSNLMQQQMGGQGGQMGGMQQTQSGGGQSSGNTFWLIAAIAVILIGVLYYLTQGRSSPTPREESPASPEQADPGAAAVKSQASGAAGTKFCIHCGGKIPADAKFCTSCGEKQS